MFDRRRGADDEAVSQSAVDTPVGARERVGGGEHTRDVESGDRDDVPPPPEFRDDQPADDTTQVPVAPPPTYLDETYGDRVDDYESTAPAVVVGGFKWGAIFYGWLVAFALSGLIIALIGTVAVAVGSLLGYSEADVDVNIRSVALVTAIVSALALIGGFLAGGYVAGRLARFDGMRQGAGVWVLGLIVGLLSVGFGAALGNEFDLAIAVEWPNIDIPQDDFTGGGLITLLVILIGTLIAALLGGRLGQRFHQRIERLA